jgi:hypothetical protein
LDALGAATFGKDGHSSHQRVTQKACAGFHTVWGFISPPCNSSSHFVGPVIRFIYRNSSPK